MSTLSTYLPEFYKVSIERAKNCHKGHWFDKGSMRFFKSRPPQYAYYTPKENAYYFISSEAFSGSQNRKYTIRRVNVSSGEISSVTEFNTLTKSQAKSQLAKILNCKIENL